MVKEQAKEETSQIRQQAELHGITTQNTILFKVTIVGT
jgi:hypothetical protein